VTQDAEDRSAEDRNDLEASASRWARIARLTPARIGLGRSGASLPTR
jgi:ethanolamine ammonia-lyase small subunit